MNFKDYLESVHSSTNLTLQTDYNVYGHAKTQAVSDLCNIHRFLLKFPAYVQLLASFVLIKFHLFKAPRLAKDIVQEYLDKNKPVDKSNVIELPKRSNNVNHVTPPVNV